LLAVFVTDVKLGRGGDANSHIGNIKFRQLINQYKPRYTAASRSNKPFVAEEVVQIWRNLDPPGRFLIRTDPVLGDDSTWHDVGDKRARKKASQALREKDRSDDLLASLQGHHGGIPGAASAVTAASVGAAASATAAAAAAGPNDDYTRKRARDQFQPPQQASLSDTRRVAARQEVPFIDPLAAARALNLISLEAPAPSSRPALDPLLLPTLQLLAAANQQQNSLQSYVQDKLLAAQILESLGIRVNGQQVQQQPQNNSQQQHNNGL
jgi:hypothetical protein